MDPRSSIIVGCILGLPSLAWAEFELAPRLALELESNVRPSADTQPESTGRASASPISDEAPQRLASENGRTATTVGATSPGPPSSRPVHEDVSARSTTERRAREDALEVVPQPSAPRDPLIGIQRVFYFELGSARLSETEVENLKEAAEAMKAVLSRNVAFKVRLTGHTDASGTARSNAKLSAKRAEAVARALRRSGLPSDSIEVRGFSASMLLEDALPEAQRRVEVEFMPGKEP